MTVEELAPHLKVHWPRLKQALMAGPINLNQCSEWKFRNRREASGNSGSHRRGPLIQQAVNAGAPGRNGITTFSDSSFGFRPGRSGAPSIKRAHRTSKGLTWVVDMDLEKFFDRVNPQYAVPQARDLARLRG